MLELYRNSSWMMFFDLGNEGKVWESCTNYMKIRFLWSLLYFAFLKTPCIFAGMPVRQTAGYRRAVSAEDTSSDPRLSRQRRIRRLWSTSGSTTQDEAPAVTVEAGKNDETQAILNLLYYIADDQAKSSEWIHSVLFFYIDDIEAFKTFD